MTRGFCLLTWSLRFQVRRHRDGLFRPETSVRGADEEPRPISGRSVFRHRAWPRIAASPRLLREGHRAAQMVRNGQRQSPNCNRDKRCSRPHISSRPHHRPNPLAAKTLDAVGDCWGSHTPLRRTRPDDATTTGKTTGFWLVLPLLVMAITGIIMAYPWANATLFRLAGSPSRNAPATPQQFAAERVREMARRLSSSAPRRSLRHGHQRHR